MNHLQKSIVFVIITIATVIIPVKTLSSSGTVTVKYYLENNDCSGTSNLAMNGVCLEDNNFWYYFVSYYLNGTNIEIW
jgi:hypothetical protein